MSTIVDDKIYGMSAKSFIVVTIQRRKYKLFMGEGFWILIIYNSLPNPNFIWNSYRVYRTYIAHTYYNWILRAIGKNQIYWIYTACMVRISHKTGIWMAVVDLDSGSGFGRWWQSLRWILTMVGWVWCERWRQWILSTVGWVWCER